VTWHGSRRPDRRRQLKVVVVASMTSTLSVAPPFLIGALAVQVSQDLDLSPALLGLIVSVFFASTALCSSSMGRAVDRRGVRQGLTVVMILNAVALVAIFSAGTVAHLVVAMAVAGVANGGVHPAANALLAQGIQGRLGLALGIKQASMPASTIVGGLAVPLVALTLGWRAAFLVVAVASVAVLVVTRRMGADVIVRSPPARAIRPAPLAGARPSIGRLSVGAALGASASSSLGTFLVDSGVQLSGLSEAATGWVFASAGLVGFLTRIAVGHAADSRPTSHAYRTCVVMLLLGTAGMVMVASGEPRLYVVGAWLAFGAGWGWPGLVHFAVISESREGAARATGRLLFGFAGGSALGPVALGQVVETWGYPMMWAVAAVLGVLACGVFASLGWRRRAQ
jgi:predicted MFS family arabinose efflux permease